MTLQPRDYQLQCLEKIKKGNTIISMPTGGGKTLVAVLALDHFLAKRGKAIFAVPTRVLVEQQAKYCREKCQHRRLVVELSGGEMDSWGKDRWRQCVCENEILVGTPEVFRKALVENGYITPLDFSIIIFDECHNATGNSPMAAIMKDAVWKVSGQPGCPRILGLTASYVNGSLKNLEQKREQLETLLQASLFSPDVPAHLVAGGVAGSGSTSKFRYVTFQEDVSREACSEAEKKLDALLGDFQNTVQMQVKECRKLVTRTCHVLEELGMAAFRDALKNCIQPQMDAHAEQLASLADEKSKKLAAHLRSQMPQLTQRLQQLGNSVGTTGQLRGVPTISGKAHRLLELLTTLFQPRSRDGTYRGIIFVTQVALIMPLAHLVNEQFQRTGLHIRAGAVSGVGSMTESVRNQQMDQFRRGEKNLLVCTNALEEGVDVSDCAFVIRFNKFNTTKSHIQGSGRARDENAEIYYFDNHPEEEENKAKRLDQVAKDQDLQLSEKERHRRRLASTKSRPGIYPFHSGDSEVNFFNCLQIVYEYCAKTMGQSFNPDDLFTYSEEQVCVYPPQSRRVVTEMKYPSPVGFVTVTAKEVNDYWGDVKLEEILDPDRCKNLKQEDKTKRRHLFVVAVHMHRNQLLDDKNQPTAAALASTKLACPAMNLKPGIKMKSTYSSSAAPGVGASTACPGSTPSTPSPAYTPVTPTTPAPPAPATNGNGGTMALTATTNWKGVLNEWALKTWKKPAEELLKYEEETKPEGFVSKVEVTMLRRSFTGRPGATKKNAQQSAAAEALRQLAIAV
ncbi:unnamed protein product [Cladocopium goreaui]|uniref:RNA helicase n=1 Tax=Cladocopium goreaui TaxID=2562237 RepID=A0A9P1C6M5_9DINO|nr:unnamed protein product [Cladocopium goreaui]